MKPDPVGDFSNGRVSIENFSNLLQMEYFSQHEKHDHPTIHVDTRDAIRCLQFPVIHGSVSTNRFGNDLPHSLLKTGSGTARAAR
jgi:hypothetical protein